ncbi:MerR family transcriptional regulator [Streptomyces sp. NRRL B-1347]|uniref:MerR family transcriptional regulator n=1 Tax=Streptomyces sp. NRRL B-1347 TaxID=1476877 RepID=UPI00069234DD|nr:MerR family transcriptional regulator [Streptomyces sp. NRRL B-1347]
MDLSIGEVAQRSGLSVHALRFYEREGLFANPVRRLSNGRRIYHEEDLEWLAICTKLRSSGMSLAMIREYIELVRQGPGNEHQRLDLLRRHESHVEAQIRELQDALDVMRFKVRIYEDHVARGEADRLWNPSHPAAAQAGTHQECQPRAVEEDPPSARASSR